MINIGALQLSIIQTEIFIERAQRRGFQELTKTLSNKLIKLLLLLRREQHPPVEPGLKDNMKLSDNISITLTKH